MGAPSWTEDVVPRCPAGDRSTDRAPSIPDPYLENNPGGRENQVEGSVLRVRSVPLHQRPDGGREFEVRS
ncbi:MAG: hypothetical protein EA422_12560, partial [Gemmatimonadales bacterium]